ncbi:anillin-like isoform X3 [Haliotis rufescens]|uniref:anillin-like isoform X3 n=1 Tax=Haliotis rufescens TaxID=6454 RepID=UPI00201EF0A0|nr:anillin-like isoform X3 [Haliotis rufescens]
MDPYTEKLIERTRQRREMLNQKLGKTPDPTPRKRRTPLGEDTTDNIIEDPQQNDESPKRQCVRETEREVKEDTPAITGVRSRLQQLSQQRDDWSDNPDAASPVPVPRKSLSNCLDDENTPSQQAPPSRRGRLAALAQNINSWEEDLSQPKIQKEEEPKPRWQPPRAPSEDRSKSNAPQCPPTGVQNSPKKYRAPQPPTSVQPEMAKVSPVKPHRAAPSPVKSKLTFGNLSNSSISTQSPSRRVEQKMSSPLTPQVRVPPKPDDRRLTAQIPVNVRGLNESDGEKTDDEPTSKPVSERFNSWAKKTTCETPKASKSVDPTQTPVSARMANWEKKVNETPAATPTVTKVLHTPRQMCTPAKPPNAPDATVSKVLHTPRQMCTPAKSQNAPARPISTPSMAAVKSSQPTPRTERPVSMVSAGSDDPTTRSVSERMAKWQEQTKPPPVEEEPTAYSVNARMSAWEHMSSSNQVSYIKKVNPGEQPVSPQKSPARPPPPGSATKKGVTPSKVVMDAITERAQQIMATSPAKTLKSCPLSPNSASGTMKSVHQRLMEQTHNSSKSQDIMEKLRGERMAELQTIQNRWKNGILKEDNSSDQPASQASANGTTPTVAKQEKKEAIRAKARAEFDNKLAAMGFDLSDEGQNMASFNFKGGNNQQSYNQHVAEEKQSSTGQPPAGFIPPPPPPPPSGAAPPPKPPSNHGPAASKPPVPPSSGQQGKGTSIYRIISHKGNAPAPRPSQQPAASHAVHRQASINSRKVQFDDSFDSTDESEAVRTSFDDDTESQTDITAPESDSEPETEDVSESEMEEVVMRRKPVHQSRPRPPVYEEDDVSLSAFVPDSVRRESVLPTGPEDHRRSFTSETSVDSFEEPHHTAPRNPYRSTSNLRQMAQDSSSSLASSVDSNRDDIDDLLDEAMDSDDSGAPVPAPRRHHHQTRNETDRSLIYSVSAYRSSRHLQAPPPAKMIISRHSKYVDSDVHEEDVAMPRQPPPQEQRKSVQERIQELQELVQQEQSVIMQTSNALNQCCSKDSYFAGSPEQVECNRVLLVACQKRQSYMLEIQRLKNTGNLDKTGPGPKGSLTLNDIRLPLKKEFVTKIGTSQDNTTYYFIILIRKDTQVICTQMLSTHEPMMRGSLDFPNLIKINGITGDFRLDLEIYGMSVSKEILTKDKKKQKTPKKSKHGITLQSPGGPTAVRTTSFSHITTVPITMKSLDKTCFNLERLPYLSPLHGSIYLRLKCLMEANVEERGFLTMFEDVSGLGAWHRRWVALARNKLCYWKYPDDENRKDPMGMIDLKRCITEKVGLIPRDICARPNTFELMTVRQPRHGERDTLVSRTYNTMTTIRHMMSADTKEERIVWCNKVNRALANIRTWHSDALPPVKIPNKNS